MSCDSLFLKKAGMKLLMVGFILTLVLLGRTDAKSETPPPDSVFINAFNGGTLPFNPAAVKWQIIHGDLTVFAIDAAGAIKIWINSAGAWRESQTLAAPGGAFSTFQLQDLDRDGETELIAGTADTGFLFVYRWADGAWLPQNSEKYVWSTITGIAAGHLDDTGLAYLLVQNREGFLYLFKQKDQALDLVWKSPVVWRPFASVFVADLDGDRKDEITVSYSNGAVAVLKMVNNSIVAVWENYVWGKILAITAATWDHKSRTKLVFSTTQKMIYFLGYSEKGFQFEAQLSQFPFIAENLAVPATAAKELWVIDTAGKFHLLQSSLPAGKWVESANQVTGRAAQLVIGPQSGQIRVWGASQTESILNIIHSDEIRLIFQGESFRAQPPPLFQKGRWYLAPGAIAAFAELRIQSQITKASYRILIGNSWVEISKKQPAPIKLDGGGEEKPENCLIIHNEPYLSLELWQRFLKLQLHLEATPPNLEIDKLEAAQP